MRGKLRKTERGRRSRKGSKREQLQRRGEERGSGEKVMKVELRMENRRRKKKR